MAITRSIVGAADSNIDSMAKWIDAAAAEGAKLICFPELNLSGYDTNDSIRKAAEPINGPSVRRISEIARQKNIFILAGFAEIDANGRIYATHAVISPQGLVGAYRKLHLGPPEHKSFAAGDTIPLFEVAGLTFGIQLCYDAHFPELSTQMALKGADAIFIPHASPGRTPEEKYHSWSRHLTARAYDNGVFIVAGNAVGENGKGLTFPGVGLVIDPCGNIRDSYTGSEAHLMVADLKKEDIAHVREHPMRYFLPNRRPELYRE